MKKLSLIPWLAFVLIFAWAIYPQRYEHSNLDNVQSHSGLIAGKGGDLASGATITPTHTMHNVTGIGVVQTITAPAGLKAGTMLVLVPKGIFTANALENVAVGVTAVVDRALILVWNGTVWVPTYLL